MITQAEVKKLFAYKNGKLFWKVARQAIQVGAVVTGKVCEVQVDPSLLVARP